MKILPVALLVAFVVPAGAIAQADHAPASNETVLPQDPADSEEIVVEGEVPEKQRRICETRTETGSIIPKRVCRTRAQIEEEERIARESAEIIRRDRDTRAFVQMSREQGS